LTVQFQTFDDDYLRRLRDGDSQVEQHFASYFGELILLKLRRRVRTRQLMEDIRQETLCRVLRATRAAGWVSTREEFTRGFSSIAAPVLVSGHPVAAISVAGPTTHILGLRRDFIVASVCRAAQRVSTLIGDCLWSAAANAS